MQCKCHEYIETSGQLIAADIYVCSHAPCHFFIAIAAMSLVHPQHQCIHLGQEALATPASMSKPTRCHSSSWFVHIASQL